MHYLADCCFKKSPKISMSALLNVSALLMTTVLRLEKYTAIVTLWHKNKLTGGMCLLEFW